MIEDFMELASFWKWLSNSFKKILATFVTTLLFVGQVKPNCLTFPLLVTGFVYAVTFCTVVVAFFVWKFGFIAWFVKCYLLVTSYKTHQPKLCQITQRWSLDCSKKLNGHQTNKTRKSIVQVVKNRGFKTEIKKNLIEVGFLDIICNFFKGTF